jgi:long-chain fatty acid transport protein
MRSAIRTATVSSVALGTLALSSVALATNGYFTHGVGAESKGMAGAGVGSSAFSGPIISATNPALGVFADDAWEAGLSIFSPRRSYVASSSQLNGGIIGDVASFTVGEGQVDSSSEYFPIPYVAKNWRLDNDRAVTFVFYGRGGMNTDWDSTAASASSLFCDPTGQAPTTGPGPYCAGEAGVDLSQAFVALNYAGRTGDKFAWGIGPVFAVQAFEATGVASFTPITKSFYENFVATGQPGPVAGLSNNGHDFSYGLGVGGGIWYGLSDNISVGLAFQSKMSMSSFDDYSDLFAEGGSFDIPASAKLGVSFGGAGPLRLHVDVEHTMYSEVDSIANPMVNILGCPTTRSSQNPNADDPQSCLGGARGAGFGWEDMTTFKVGFEWATSDSNTFRFGASYGEQPIQGADVLFNILAPGVVEQHYTVGWTHTTQRGSAWTASFMYAPETSVTGPNFFDPTQTIELKMDQLEFEVAFRW